MTSRSDKALHPADIDWVDARTPRSIQFDDIYFSKDDALEEIRYNFIDHNDLPQRFNRLPAGATFRIAETGFGSGLNFLAAIKLWLESTTVDQQLHFISFEKFPMKPDDLAKVHACYTDLQDYAQPLREAYPLSLPGWHELLLFDGRVRLTLWFGDVADGLPQCDASEFSRVDAWFLDGFAPAKNPQMWQPELYRQMARLSKEGSSFATFTAAGEVRRGLAAAGFEVDKDSGYGRKREMCFGRLPRRRPYSLKAPWFARPGAIAGRKAVVVGAGLAGASVAYRLALSGWQVTVLEENSEPACLASGNLAGTLHPLITADWNLRSQWYLRGYETTLNWLEKWLQEDRIQGDLNGLVQLLTDDKSVKATEDAFERFEFSEAFARQCDAEQASELLGTRSNYPGVFYARSGWIFPRSVVDACLEHAAIKVVYQCKLIDLQRDGDNWLLHTSRGDYSADSVIFASGSLDEDLNRRFAMPIRPVKGQVSHLASLSVQQPLKRAVTHAGYSSPAANGRWVSGATFEAPDMGMQLSCEGHKTNLQNAVQALPDWLRSEALEDQALNGLEGRIAFRPTTPDHLPIVGAIADADFMQQAYFSQSHTHAVYRYPEQRYLPGLYVSNGHGPRGLMSVFLAAEILAAEMNGEALPLPLSLYQATHPARFQIRQWRSGKM
ncbi:bifunctional tRNA (5-methylaminomethyl-2-thiouridine)(34)-methyltransferase MnmD/FAD-dependent 5-carboxymethylaminomethyl-2-thiouridine(34) oxidoreductase MnmC [Thiomicrorhabdus sp.]|uniref:bifunctional tRNA (5-methylaminomethyl-2-thiouridine)(34)-methyltransferase MnmD/FAD-dependent 5-carboxymethylaminomethyl-2-thiouridine(34) oxidoreductase MnmC n=1 Tax=Thiomicrorhabdus sp. TaxID=2039724 RepID=UPI0029C99CA9|nr:bifunctional tRNA (5-methylaminomethyl-2-thiouridine)(34)-methyltransferase MnmD/FAD-dependent 5-carboxymethylaminomethyl-2-thiouridine(34) oxidoreductase MnmC [Thiomicrorhabdus sp.]